MLMDYLILISIKTLKEDICGKFQRRLLRGTTEKNLTGILQMAAPAVSLTIEENGYIICAVRKNVYHITIGGRNA